MRRVAALLLVVAGAAACKRTSRFATRGDGEAVVVREKTEDVALTITDEHEPNDSLGKPEVLTLAGDPLTVTVRGALLVLPKGLDVDTFRITVPGALPDAGADAGVSSRRLDVQVVPEAPVGLILQLLDGDGRAIESIPGLSGETIGVPNAAVLPGASYFVRLRPTTETRRALPDAGAVGRGYRLTIRLTDFDLGDEREPNDRAALATELPIARSSPEAAGLFGWRHDEDWFRLPLDGLPAGTVVDVELESVDGVSASLSLVDARQARLATLRGRSGARVVLRNLAPGVLASRPMGDAGMPPSFAYLIVRAESGHSLDRRYALRVRPAPAREGMELEPNDDAARATALGEGVAVGFLVVGDVDVYRWKPPTGIEGLLELTVPPRSDLRLEVLREHDGRVVAKADGAGKGQPKRVATGASSEPLLVRVSLVRGEGDPDEPYQLRLVSRPVGSDAGATP